MSTQPISIRLTPEDIEILDAIAAHLTHQHGIRIGRGQTVRQLLKRATPPTEPTPTARHWRILHNQHYGDTP
jgi:hypothetical protein